jgi:hypothetical protein
VCPRQFTVSECTEQLGAYGSARRGCGTASHLGRVKEWLDYHAMVGVQHFYFYDNRWPILQSKPLLTWGLSPRGEGGRESFLLSTLVI